MNSPMQNAIVHEVETAVSNTKQDLLNSMAVLIDCRLDTFQSNIQQSDFQISKIEESVTYNFLFQRNGNENQNTDSVKVMSKLKEARSILENPNMNSQKVVAAKAPTWIFFRVFTMLDSSASRLPSHMLWGCVLTLGRISSLNLTYLPA
jgi:hypothetical protein